MQSAVRAGLHPRWSSPTVHTHSLGVQAETIMARFVFPPRARELRGHVSHFSIRDSRPRMSMGSATSLFARIQLAIRSGSIFSRAIVAAVARANAQIIFLRKMDDVAPVRIQVAQGMKSGRNPWSCRAGPAQLPMRAITRTGETYALSVSSTRSALWRRRGPGYKGAYIVGPSSNP